MTDLKLFEVLLAFSREKTLTKTARTLYMSQPGVSQSLQRLEKELDVRLFERSGHNQIRLNQTGQFAVEKAEELLSLWQEAINEIRNFERSQKQIAVGSCAPLPLWTLDPALEAILDHAASFTLESEEEKLFEKLIENEYDLIVLSKPVLLPDYVCAFFMKETLELAVPLHHPLAEKAAVHYEDLNDQNLLLYEKIGIWMQLLKNNTPQTHYLKIEDYPVFLEAARTQAFPFFTTDQLHSNIPAGFRILPIDEPDCTHSFYLVTKECDRSLLETIMKKKQEEVSDRSTGNGNKDTHQIPDK